VSRALRLFLEAKPRREAGPHGHAPAADHSKSIQTLHPPGASARGTRPPSGDLGWFRYDPCTPMSPSTPSSSSPHRGGGDFSSTCTLVDQPSSLVLQSSEARPTHRVTISSGDQPRHLGQLAVRLTADPRANALLLPAVPPRPPLPTITATAAATSRGSQPPLPLSVGASPRLGFRSLAGRQYGH
jgi:hypothetical protein